MSLARPAPGEGDPGRLRATAGAVALSAGALALGVVLGAVGARYGPLWVLASPVAVVGALLTQRRPPAVLQMVVLSLPVGFATLPVAGLQVVEATVLAAGALAALARLSEGQPPLRWPVIAWWPAAVLALALLSTTTAVDVGLAVKQLALLAGGMVLLLTAVTVLRRLDDVRAVLRWFAVVGAALSLQGLAGAGQLETSSGGLRVDNRPSGIFSSPNQLGALAGMVVLVGVGLLVGARRRADRVAGTVAVVGGGAGLAVTLSRGAWLATALALLAYTLLVPEARRLVLRWAVPAMGVAVAGALLLPTADTQVDVIQDRIGTLAAGETSRYDSRDAIWAEGVRQVRDAPLLGQGPGNFPVVSAHSTSEATTVGAHHAHNVVLNVAAEFGVPALLLVAGFAVSLLVLLRRTGRRVPAHDRAVLAGVGAALSVQALHGMVDYTLRNAVLSLVAWLLAGVLVAASEVSR